MEEQTKKIEEEKENKDGLSVKKSPENKQTQKTNSNLIIWIILSVGLVIILTIIVLIVLKFQKSKNTAVVNTVPVQNEITSQATSTPSQTSKPLTKEELLKQAFYYPNATAEKKTDWDREFIYYTDDSVTTAYNYYEELISLNNWELGSSGMATDISGGFLYVYQDDFTADVNVKEVSNEAGSTEILVRIYNKEDIPLTSTLNRPTLELTQPTPPPDAKPSQTSDQSEYVLSFSNSRKITKEDLAGLTHWQLKVARNEIYARHGREFVHQDLSCYFDKLSWYEINPVYSENNLSSLEISNAVFILSYEKEINSSLINKDTGCK